jgi:hypothetical protein
MIAAKMGIHHMKPERFLGVIIWSMAIACMYGAAKPVKAPIIVAVTPICRFRLLA